MSTKPIYRQSQLFTFLLYCNNTGLDKVVLDCGAGGKCPPLGIFAEHGYKTLGVESSKEQLELVHEFEKAYGFELGIQVGDMKQLPYKDGSISYAYSYNSIFHMKKTEIRQAIGEICRVLSKGGLAFINFASVNDARAAEGQRVGDGEYLQSEYGEQVLHSYFDKDEAEQYFDGFKVIYKETRIREGYNQQGEKLTMGYIDYILEKI